VLELKNEIVKTSKRCGHCQFSTYPQKLVWP